MWRNVQRIFLPELSSIKVHLNFHFKINLFEPDFLQLLEWPNPQNYSVSRILTRTFSLLLYEAFLIFPDFNFIVILCTSKVCTYKLLDWQKPVIILHRNKSLLPPLALFSWETCNSIIHATWDRNQLMRKCFKDGLFSSEDDLKTWFELVLVVM